MEFISSIIFDLYINYEKIDLFGEKLTRAINYHPYSASEPGPSLNNYLQNKLFITNVWDSLF